MFTTHTKHPDGEYGPTIEANIVLTDGTTAGTGYGPTTASAQYWACRDTLASAHAALEAPGGSLAHRQARQLQLLVAACGHWRSWASRS